MVANRNLAPQAGKYARYELERRWLLERLPEGADAGSMIVDRYIEGLDFGSGTPSRRTSSSSSPRRKRRPLPTTRSR
jgi:hypothetical protein